MTHDPRIDAYIAKAAPFAQPILAALRERLHAALSVTETVKWGRPFFEHEGRPFAFMAAFKAHAAFGFWRGSDSESGGGLGQMGKLTSLADLPDEAAFQAMVADALAQPRASPAAREAKPEATVPDDLRSALDAVPDAATAFAGFPPGARREYIEWVTEAKQPATRARRIADTVAWSAEGKRRNWKHEGR